MRSWFAGLLKTLFGESIARALGGAGISVVSAAIMLPAMTTALNAAAAAMGGAGDILDVAMLFGLGEAMSIMGSAMLTRLAMNSGKLGLRKAAG